MSYPVRRDFAAVTGQLSPCVAWLTLRSVATRTYVGYPLRAVLPLATRCEPAVQGVLCFTAPTLYSVRVESYPASIAKRVYSDCAPVHTIETMYSLTAIPSHKIPRPVLHSSFDSSFPPHTTCVAHKFWDHLQWIRERNTYC